MPSAGCAAGYSEHPEPAAAVGEVIGEVLARVEPHPELAVVMASGAMVARLEDVVGAVQALVAPQVLIGTSATGLLGGPADRLGLDGLLLWVAGVGEGQAPQPLRFDPQLGERGWHGPHGRPSDGEAVADAVNLVFSAGDAPRDGLPGTTIGMVGRRARLVLDGQLYETGGVGVQLPAGAVEPILFAVPPEPAVTPPGGPAGGEDVVGKTGEDQPPPTGELMFDPGHGCGMLLFGTAPDVALMAARLDFELAADRFSGTMAAAASAAPVAWPPAIASTAGTAPAAEISGLIVR